ncbi:MAG: diaminopimelate epimerase, partial [Oscillospiraceae bacterium]|nr:diaminopimelate epimerase [Oscillospiraceae bacterium]
MKFTKMQGIGNDYVYVNCFEEKIENPEALSVRISDRHFGIGADGLVLIMPSDKADFRMRMFNADGSEGMMCGNASRCIGKYVYDNGLTDKTEITLETKSGIKSMKLFTENGSVQDGRGNHMTLIPISEPTSLRRIA